MASVRGYEEKNPDTMRHLTSGYPRFVVHPFAKQLAAHFIATDPSLTGRTLWLTTSERMARLLVAQLEAGGFSALPFTRDGVHGASHATDASAFARAKTFLQNIGGFISSREAEDQLK